MSHDPAGSSAPADAGARNRGDPESTLDLLARAREGDRDALEELFSRHLRPLRRWASGRLPAWARDLADTDDLVQDILVQTFRRVDDFEPRGVGAFHAYLRQAVVNRIRDELRRRERKPETGGLDGLEVDRGRSPLQHVIGQETLESYERALARLGPGEREAIIGRLEMGYSYDELATVLGKGTPEAARKAAQRALVHLAEEMSGGHE
jgi:RNA polymerase sigma-70 factor (ECF subfamily)